MWIGILEFGLGVLKVFFLLVMVIDLGNMYIVDKLFDFGLVVVFSYCF